MIFGDDRLIFERSKEGRQGFSLPKDEFADRALDQDLPLDMRREDLDLPEVFEIDVIRHYTNLSSKNFGVDNGFYPLGSCTMKYNPKINEKTARLGGFTNLHPLQPEETVQGALKLMYELQKDLEELTGMEKVTLQPAAGSQGELTGLMMIKAYHQKRGDTNRKNIIVPDSAHGTNPASATMAGFNAVEILSNDEGCVDLEALRAVVDEETAGLMLTNPNTLGIFEKDILEIAKIIHEAGGLLYYDGANMNANMGITRPGDMGFDVVHLNIHKTLSTPHGGGGPGAGPVGVGPKLVEYLPVPYVEKKEDASYTLVKTSEDAIGSLKSFWGNFGVLVRAYTYIRMMGAEGLKRASQLAVLNANYVKESLKEVYNLPIEGVCKHEFVFAGLKDVEGVRTMDVAKGLIDAGYHPPTIYFPLIIPEALMIEPTETESKETLDQFIVAMKEIANKAKEDPEALHQAPVKMPVGRLDEVKAARKPILRYEGGN